MGMGIWLEAVEISDRIRKLKDAQLALEAAGMDVPDDLSKALLEAEDDPDGIPTDLGDISEMEARHPAAESRSSDGHLRMLVDLSKLPEGVTHIRVTISY